MKCRKRKDRSHIHEVEEDERQARSVGRGKTGATLMKCWNLEEERQEPHS
jgi:hypothetical protein